MSELEVIEESFFVVMPSAGTARVSEYGDFKLDDNTIRGVAYFCRRCQQLVPFQWKKELLTSG